MCLYWNTFLYLRKKTPQKNVVWAATASQWRFSACIQSVSEIKEHDHALYSLWRPHPPVRNQLKGLKATAGMNALPIICSLMLAELYTGLQKIYILGGISLWGPLGQKAWIYHSRFKVTFFSSWRSSNSMSWKNKTKNKKKAPQPRSLHRCSLNTVPHCNSSVSVSL